MTINFRLAASILCAAITALLGTGLSPIRAAAPEEPLAQPPYTLGPDSQAQPGVPKGETIAFDLTQSALYPGTQRTIWVYVPAQYRPEKPACLCVGLDGPGFNPQIVFDNLIAKGQMPVSIGVFLSSGTVNKPGTKEPLRFNRCFEFDSTNDRFVRFLFAEVLPAVEARKTADGRAIRISDDANDHMIYGASSGGVCAFTAAWQRPDRFQRVFTAIGTYVGMRGADEYVTLVRKTEPKPIRIFLQDGAQDTWNPLFDNWYTQNRAMEESLHWANYDVNHVWGTLGHEGSHATAAFPDVMRWLWRDYPKRITPAISPNSMLQAVLAPGKGWEPVAGDGKAGGSLAVGSGGDVFVQDTAAAAICRIAASASAATAAPSMTIFAHNAADVTASAVGPDGRLYAAGTSGKITAIDAQGHTKTIAKVPGSIKGLYVSSDSRIYATTADGSLWRIATDGSRTRLDTGLRGATGVTMTPDHNLLFVAEAATHWVYSYVVATADGALQDKQRFYWLHAAEAGSEADPAGDDSAGPADMAADRQGNLYVATRMGVQVCDRNGRVEGILTLPTGAAVTHLCFGGANFDWLYVVCGGQIYRRQLRVPGVPGWATPLPLPSFGGG